MHDPMTVIKDIHMPFTGKKNDAGGYLKYPTTIATIWHVDPETDGTDDSCGWFMRSRHGDKKVMEKIRHDFAFEYRELFFSSGHPKYSPTAITLHLFRRAAYDHFGNNWTKASRYLSDHLMEILWFAENPVDSLITSINRAASSERDENEKVEDFAQVIYGFILRDTRPWWKHPRWHIRHWKIQIHFIQNLKRFLFSRCWGCGERFSWGYSPTTTQWDNEGPQWFKSERRIYHSHCVPVPKTPVPSNG